MGGLGQDNSIFACKNDFAGAGRGLYRSLDGIADLRVDPQRNGSAIRGLPLYNANDTIHYLEVADVVYACVEVGGEMVEIAERADVAGAAVPVGEMDDLPAGLWMLFGEGVGHLAAVNEEVFLEQWAPGA